MKNDSQVCVTAVGMATALAPTAPDSCAAARAGISRICEITQGAPEDALFGEEPLTGLRAGYIASGFGTFARVLLLAQTALEDLLSRAPMRPEHQSRTGLLFHVSDCALQDQYVQSSDLEPAERPSGLWAKSCESLLPRLCRHCDLDLRRENQQLFFGAQTGFMALLQVAEDRLLRGQLDACLVGASESCLDSAFLVAAASQGALKTSNNPVGFLPGEGAAFFLLERPQSAGERQLASLLDIRVAEKEHQGRSGGFDGARLAKAMHATLASTRHLAPDVPLLALVGDLNGEEQKAWEWGNALVRLLASPEYKDTPSIFPALAFGETGAASSALALGLAICSRKRLPAQSGYMLLWASCRSGAKGALLLLI